MTYALTAVLSVALGTAIADGDVVLPPTQTVWTVALAALNVLQTIALAYLAASHRRNGHL